MTATEDSGHAAPRGEPAASLPQSERLDRNVIGLAGALIIALAFMAPALSVFFTTPALVASTGAPIPLVYLVAMLGVLCTGNALAQFSRAYPSTGSFVTFISRGLGGPTGLVSAVILLAGYTLAASTVIDIFGSWTHDVLDRNLSIDVPWQILSVAGAVAFTIVAIRGLRISTSAAVLFFAFEVIVLLVVSVTILAKGGASGLSADPISPSAITSSGGFGLAAVLAVYSFIGYEAAVPLAEETSNPRRNTPLAVLIAIVSLGLLYVFVTYSAVIGFGVDNLDELAGDSAAFDTLTERYLGGARVLVDLAGMTSIIGSALALLNVQPRILYNVSRAGFAPRALAQVHHRWRTPHRAILAFSVTITLIPLVLGAFGKDPLTIFAQVGTFGAFEIVLIYALVNVALIAHWLRTARTGRPLTHLVVPIVGVAAWGLPIYYALKPGQPSPFNYTWLAGVIPLVVGLAYLFVRRHSDTAMLAQVLGGEREVSEAPAAAEVPRAP